ncbi:MAG: hypothetical protein QOG49_14 [Frankiaceae bacterium]|jgi:hypothetical protein|nr:hypothetical protein [Frankiaceae bacterium]
MTSTSDLYLAHIALSAATRATNQIPNDPDRSAQMYLVTEELARERISQRRREADAERLVRNAVLIRRAKRKAVHAVRTRVIALATR